MERFVAHSFDEAEFWKEEEPKFRVRLNEPFKPFTVEDFAGQDIMSRDFYLGLSFTLEGFGVGDVYYFREWFLRFDSQWAEEKAATPVGPATLSYQFTLGPETKGVLVPPLELVVALAGRTDCYPPDELLEFPSYGRAILGRWERRSHDPELHHLPLVIPRKFLLPERREIRTIYLPDDPKVLSDLRVTFLATEPKVSDED